MNTNYAPSWNYFYNVVESKHSLGTIQKVDILGIGSVGIYRCTDLCFNLRKNAQGGWVNMDSSRSSVQVRTVRFLFWPSYAPLT